MEPIPDKDYNLPEVFDFERKILLYLGCFPNNGRRGISYILTASVTLSISLSIYVMMIVGIFIEYKNVSAVAETLLIAATQTACLCKILNLIIKKKNILELENILSQPEYCTYSKKNLKIMKNSVSVIQYFARTYRIICSVAIISDMFSPLRNIDGRALPLTSVWNPWDLRKKSYYISAFTFHMVSLGLSAFTNTTIDIFTCQYIMIIVGQLKIIKTGLSGIDYGSNNDCVMRNIVRNVNLHTSVLRLVEILEDTFSTAIFIQIMVSVVAICFTGFVMLDVSLGSTEFMSLFIYMNAMFMQVLLYCFFGHSIMTNSEDVNLAMYMSNWYISERSVRKTFLILMERCKAPIILTIAKIFPLNLVTLTWIMRSSYSFLAVLRTMYDRDDKN